MATRWHHSRQQKTDAAIDSKELRRLAKLGLVRPSDFVRRSGGRRWVKATRVEGLFDPEEPRWYYLREGKPIGPVSVPSLGKLSHAGVIEPNDLVWTPGLSRWRPASRIIRDLKAKADRKSRPRNEEAPHPGSLTPLS